MIPATPAKDSAAEPAHADAVLRSDPSAREPKRVQLESKTLSIRPATRSQV